MAKRRSDLSFETQILRQIDRNIAWAKRKRMAALLIRPSVVSLKKVEIECRRRCESIRRVSATGGPLRDASDSPGVGAPELRALAAGAAATLDALGYVAAGWEEAANEARRLREKVSWLSRLDKAESVEGMIAMRALFIEILGRGGTQRADGQSA